MARRITANVLNLRPEPSAQVERPVGLGKVVFVNEAGELKKKDSAGVDTDLGGTPATPGSSIAPTSISGNQVTFDSNDNPIIGLSDSSGNTVTYNGIPLYVQLEAVAGLVGIDIFEHVVKPQTVATPIQDFGDNILVGNKLFKKQKLGGYSNLFVYVLDKQATVSAKNISLAGVTNASVARKQVGSIAIPGDAMYKSPRSKVTVTVTANAPIVNATVSVGFSMIRNQQKYWVERAITGGTSNVMTMEFYVTPTFCSKVSLDQVQASTAPTFYPYASKVMDVNLLGGLRMPINFKFDGSASSTPTITVTSIEAKVDLLPPVTGLYDPKKIYRRMDEQPFQDDDLWNSPILSGVVAQLPVFTHSWASTGSNSSGTANAIGTAGSDIITVQRTAGVKVGMFPAITDFYGIADDITVNNSTATTYQETKIKSKATLLVFGAGSYVTEIIDGTTLRMSKPLLTNLSERGKESWGAIHGLAFYSSVETMSIRMGGYATGDTQYGMSTGVLNTASVQANYWTCRIPVARQSKDDQVKQWWGQRLVSFNGWPFDTPVAQDTTFGENFQGFSYFMKTPSIITPSWITPSSGDRNPDANLVIISENGQVAIEHIGVYFDSGNNRWTAFRSLATGLDKKSTTDMLKRPEFVAAGGVSDGTRAFGGEGLLGGQLRPSDFVGFPDSSKTNETPQEIDANIIIAQNAIRHAVAMVPDATQTKSAFYCDEYTTQTKIRCKGYISQLDRDLPIIAAAGSGYVVGEVLTVQGGVSLAPMRVTVTAIGSSGEVSGVFVSTTGQYKTLPSDGAALATTASKLGTGCVLSVINLPGNSAVTSLATAFPNLSPINTMQYPGTAVDSVWETGYTGSFPIGGICTVDQSADFAAIFKARRLASPAAYTSSYEALAVLTAIQRYGAVHTDIAYYTHWLWMYDLATPFINTQRADSVMLFVKNQLIYIENITPLGKGTAGTPRAQVVPMLPPAN